MTFSYSADLPADNVAASGADLAALFNEIKAHFNVTTIPSTEIENNKSWHEWIFCIDNGINIATNDDERVYYNATGSSLKIVSVWTYLETLDVSLDFNIDHDDDGAPTWLEIFSADQQITAAGHPVVAYTALQNTVFGAGRMMRFKVTAVGGAANQGLHVGVIMKADHTKVS